MLVHTRWGARPGWSSQALSPHAAFARLSGRFNVEKGYGFIALDGADNDIFVHQSDIYAPGFRSLAEGEPVRPTISVLDPAPLLCLPCLASLSLSPPRCPHLVDTRRRAARLRSSSSASRPTARPAS